MPQLDPSPWFLILFSSWIIFLLMTPNKTAKYQNLNDPSPKTHYNSYKSWFWPWP